MYKTALNHFGTEAGVDEQLLPTCLRMMYTTSFGAKYPVVLAQIPVSNLVPLLVPSCQSSKQQPDPVVHCRSLIPIDLFTTPLRDMTLSDPEIQSLTSVP